MTARTRFRSVASLAVVLVGLVLAGRPGGAVAQQVQPPAEYIGHEMGADRQLADWDQLLDYYRHLAENSPRLRLEEMGPTTLGRRHSGTEAPGHVSGLDLGGNTFVVLYVSSAQNLQNLPEIRRTNALISDPRGASEAEIEQAIDEGKAVVAQSYGLHSNEVAATQTAAEVVYELVSREDEKISRIRENTVSVIFPSLNPDGTEMITDWYRQTKGTDHEGVSMPWLYHHYIGHDNNRDAYMQNTIESRYVGEILFREWVPQAYVDHHEMGNDGPRFYVPPYSEPIRPDADPLVWREMDWFGAHMAYSTQQAGIDGVTDGAIYSGWGHFGWHWITPFHNIAGMLTESARTGRYATPTHFQSDQLEGSPGRGFPYYGEQVRYPDPWEGGSWRLSDIVEQQRVASIATLDIAARHREKVLRNAYLKAHRQTERGRDGNPAAAYVIPADQHDPLTATKMVNRLLWQGVDVSRAEQDFVHEGRAYDAGSFVVSLAQPKRGVIRWLLGQTFYPDNAYTRDDDGDPIWPYDLATHTMYEFMGVDVHPVDTPVEASLSAVESELDPAGTVEAGPNGYVVDGRLNDSFHAMNLLMDEGVTVRRVDQPPEGSDLRPGDFLVPADAPEATLSSVAETTGVDFAPRSAGAQSGSRVLDRLRVGMYQPFYGGNMDEGWTRMLLENFGFPYDTIRDEAITAGGLAQDYDVLILPEEDLEMMMGPDMEDWELKPPSEYQSGFGEDGVQALDRFVQNGGTLLTFGNAGDLPLQEFDLPVENKAEGLVGGDSQYGGGSGEGGEFWAPGSTLRMNIDTGHPLGYGMPSTAYGLFWAENQVYQTHINPRSQDMHRFATYPERDVLQSGWLEGEEFIAEETAAISVPHGEGDVVLLGFRPQFRHTTHGTFKLIFNALVDRPADPTPQSGAPASTQQ